jgi:predicted nucleotidyltransferase
MTMGVQERMDEFQLDWILTNSQLVAKFGAINEQLKQELDKAQRERSDLVEQVKQKERENERLARDLLGKIARIRLLEAEQKEARTFARHVLDNEAQDKNCEQLT